MKRKLASGIGGWIGRKMALVNLSFGSGHRMHRAEAGPGDIPMDW